jgi:hypothetical protein
MKPIDKNQLLNIYSYHFGNKEKDLFDYGSRNGIKNINDIIDEFSSIQNELFNYFWKRTGPNIQLTDEEIKQQAKEYCNNKYKWINEVGMEALLRWLIWMGWHEGLMKNEA